MTGTNQTAKTGKVARLMRQAGDMWRVDVAGYLCSVRGEAAKNHLESVNRKLARMRLALHKLAWRDDDAGRVARLALEIDSAAKSAS